MRGLPGFVNECLRDSVRNVEKLMTTRARAMVRGNQADREGVVVRALKYRLDELRNELDEYSHLFQSDRYLGGLDQRLAEASQALGKAIRLATVNRLRVARAVDTALIEDLLAEGRSALDRLAAFRDLAVA
jgi:hypothetical protein